MFELDWKNFRITKMLDMLDGGKALMGAADFYSVLSGISADFNPKFANFYPWLKIGKFQIPVFYIVFIVISILIWYFIWR